MATKIKSYIPSIDINNVAKMIDDNYHSGKQFADLVEVFKKDFKLLKAPFGFIKFKYKFAGIKHEVYCSSATLDDTNYNNKKLNNITIINDDTKFIFYLNVYEDGNIETGLQTADELLTAYDQNKATLRENFIELSEKRIKELGYQYYILYSPILYAIQLLNCKNVTIIDKPQLTEKYYKKAAREGKIIYKVLKVDYLNKYKLNNKNDLQNKNLNSLHICRGHFRTYTENKKLFGKHIGTYYVMPHLRGNENNGTVIKDYELANG